MNRDAKIFTMILVGFLLSCVAFLCFADTFRITGSSYTWDTFLSYNAQATNYGGSFALSVRESGGLLLRVALIKFDLSNISGVVTAAHCSLYVDAQDYGEVYIVSSRCITNWVEMECTWDSSDTGEGGHDWAAGDFSAVDFTQNSDTVTIQTTDGWFVWDVTPICSTQVVTSANYGMAFWATPASSDDCNEAVMPKEKVEPLRQPILYGTYTTGGGGVVVKKAVLGKVELP